MKNVEWKVDKRRLVITINLDNNQGPSKSGKTDIIASTEGFVHIDDKITFSLNAIKKR